MARATLAPREGMAAQVPALRKRPLADMKDMGMGEMDMGGMQGMDASGGYTMAGMDHAAMGHDMPTGGAAAGGMAGMDMGHGAYMPTTEKPHGGPMAGLLGMDAPDGDDMAGMGEGGRGGQKSGRE